MSKIAKSSAASKAVSYVENDMILGLGTGSTTYFAIQLIGEKVANGLKISGVPTSIATEQLARKLNIPILNNFVRVDLTIDGADEVDPGGNLIKGGGGALTREKMVASASTKEIIIVDESKLVKELGQCPLPVEVVRFGTEYVMNQLQRLGCQANLRRAEGELFVTDNQNHIIDCRFSAISNPKELANKIVAIPGVVECGLFIGLADKVIVGYEDGRTREMDFQG